MAQNYIRNFITLHQETPEISEKGKVAFGKCIIESKNGSGKVTFSAQNIKNQTPYSAYIISVKDKASVGVEIGKIIPGSKGNCEVKFECDGLNVENSGIALEEFTIAAIILKKEDGISTPLIGYLNGECIWKSNFRIHGKLHNKKEEKTITQPLAESLFAEDSIKEEAHFAEEASGILIEEEALQEKFSTEAEKFSTEEVEQMQSDLFEERPARSMPQIDENMESEQKLKEIAKKINSKLEEISNMKIENLIGDSVDIDEIKNCANENLTAEEIKNIHLIFQNCSRMRPFKNHDSTMEWVRISPNELNYMPKDAKIFAKDHFTSMCYRKFNHIILGKMNMNEKIVLLLGAPDVYCHENKELSALSGFTDFKCCDCSEVIEGKHGYWLKTFGY